MMEQNALTSEYGNTSQDKWTTESEAASSIEDV